MGANLRVFLFRVDTDSQLNALAGGRVFPGVHHHSTFMVEDSDGRISMRIKADDLEVSLYRLSSWKRLRLTYFRKTRFSIHYRKPLIFLKADALATLHVLIRPRSMDCC
ncbi:MAG: hypothetical protein AAF585_08135 [Verrucomicrobiota bacterium]